MSDDSNLNYGMGDNGLIQKILTEKYAYISDVRYMQTLAQADSRLGIIKEKILMSGFGIAVPDGWPYKKYFDAV